MIQYCVYTRDDKFLEVASWISTNNIKFEPHLNRTRFWIPDGVLMTEFLLKYGDICPRVMESSEGYTYATL
jgi:hypothetical protein